MITSSQCRAARALIEWTKAQLAEAAGLTVRTISEFERGKKTPREASLKAIETALFDGGVILIAEDRAGVGVRLKFTRREVKAIDVMENEGGPVGDDDRLP